VSEPDRDFWGEGLDVTVLTPAVLLHEQGEVLTKKTQGVLRADPSAEIGGGFFTLYFDVVSPAVGRRVRLMQVKHREDAPYPSLLTAEALEVPELNLGIGTTLVVGSSQIAFAGAWGVTVAQARRSRVARDQQEFLSMLQEVLGSPATRGNLQSLLALTNELGKTPGWLQYPTFTDPPPSEQVKDAESGEKKG
jgi:hypothetical protein